jgi:hypothetical protein
MLGKKKPDWGISRWNCNSGLRFVPPDDEGFALRGDKQRLLYKGRRRSHRFTILGDTAFEYDCILEREPESNVISLLMEGAEYYDFFRQPDFVKEPFLKGSYAVYKKETLLGEGTGKLCHIHRPEIIDARGRRCWGELAVVGNELRITVPERWLSEAKYPVVVDPTIGTTTVGSQYFIEYDEDDIEYLLFEADIPVNRFLVAEQIQGNCSAYFYTNLDDSEAGGRPVIYSESYNQPHLRKSSQENFINLRVTRNNPKGWRNGTFNVNDIIQPGSYIWFGLYTEYMWYPRFDYGGYFWDAWTDEYTSVPDIYPYYKAVAYPLIPNEYKVSMYFTYSAAQNYIRTLTQGVNLTDSQKINADYKRNAIQTISINSAISRFETLYRECVMAVTNSIKISRNSKLMRILTEHIKATALTVEKRSLARKCFNAVTPYTVTKKFRGVFRYVKEIAYSLDIQELKLLIMRSLKEAIGVTHTFRNWVSYIRSLKHTAESEAVTIHQGEYHRKQADNVQAAGLGFRSLFMPIRIATTLFIRDFVLRRFLKARSELVLKSCISREITLDSPIGDRGKYENF